MKNHLIVIGLVFLLGGCTKPKEPRTAGEFLKRADARAKNGEFRESLADYDRAIQLAPNSVEALSGRGMARWMVSEDGAVADYTKAIELNPRDPILYVERAWVRTHTDGADAAIADCSKALEINPKCAKAYYGRGLGYQQKKDSEKALADFNRAIELDSKMAEAYFERAKIRWDKGDAEGTVADITKAHELRPDMKMMGSKWLEEARARLKKP